MEKLQERGRADAQRKRKLREEKREHYGRPEGVSFAKEGDLKTVPRTYILWIDDENQEYQLEAYPADGNPVTSTMRWSQEPRFGMGVQDAWKLYWKTGEMYKPPVPGRTINP